jgi:Rieske Fe-S protein
MTQSSKGQPQQASTPQPQAESSTSHTAVHPPAGPAPRRSFLVELSALVIGAVAGVSGLLAGLLVFFDPLMRKKQMPKLYRRGGGAGDDFLRITSLDAVPLGGAPQRFPVLADQIDAWNFSPGQPVGAVYIRRTGPAEVEVFHATCPHAGCAVTYVDGAKAYHCPCHNSSFDINGQKLNQPGKDNPSPRDMDTLEVDADRLQRGEIWVKFVDFYTGIEDKRPKI